MVIREPAIEELTAWWDKQIEDNPGNNSWVVWKKTFVEENKSNKRKTFFALSDNNEYIGQCTLLFKGRNPNLSGNGKAEIIKLEVIEKERGKGISTRLYEVAKKYAKDNGYHTLTIGVEPSEIRNMQIYFHWGFVNYIECITEKYPPRKQGEQGEEVTILCYSQSI